MAKKLIITLLYVLIAAALYVYREEALHWMQNQPSVVPVALAATLMALFPVIPYPIVGAVLGAAYGPLLGGALTWIGSTAASLLMFLFVRYAYQEWGRRALERYQRLDQITRLFERNAFLMILFARLIPVIPSIIINVYAALGRVSFGVYAVASSLGKIPAMLLFVIIGDSLVLEPRNIGFAVAIYGVFLVVTLSGYRMWARSQQA